MLILLSCSTISNFLSKRPTLVFAVSGNCSSQSLYQQGRTSTQNSPKTINSSVTGEIFYKIDYWIEYSGSSITWDLLPPIEGWHTFFDSQDTWKIFQVINGHRGEHQLKSDRLSELTVLDSKYKPQVKVLFCTAQVHLLHSLIRRKRLAVHWATSVNFVEISSWPYMREWQRRQPMLAILKWFPAVKLFHSWELISSVPQDSYVVHNTQNVCTDIFNHTFLIHPVHEIVW